MADRHAPPPRASAAGVSKARNGMPSSASVRRNLFQSQLTRRPTALSPAPEDLHLDDDAQKEHHHNDQFQTQTEASFPQDDIVVRDHNGEIELGDPPTPTIDDPEDMEALEARHEDEMERERLAEAVKQHQIDRHSVLAQPEGKDPSSSCSSSMCSGRHISPELLEAVKTSLRAKVAALEEDNWLYEPGALPQRHQ
ncbi:hypothetical protein C8A01DRAFT_46782 [Parachaetomium inaequale]|uniref:Uncharacterized protein n=1 Tax=Parachaetomium inaequale TaxID=2588326 RepID=A0AAN6PFR7_9PEZI|nr:hypothetical protein C8A01DRAFT_46782 [Parachaetomium inaequale]